MPKDTLVVNNLFKYFGEFTAVKGTSFAMEIGECLGLLGANGAGKSTTFAVLTADVLPTHGTVCFQDGGLQRHKSKYLSSIGYSPQTDDLVACLTGEEMLRLLLALRGTPRERMREEVSSWTALLELEEYAGRICGNCSWGIKRKISTALALVGELPLVFLDEPSLGVDPLARRKLWQTLHHIRKDGRGVILISHRLEECETLCTRIAVMVNGQFKCLGSPQDLKSKFGKGFSIGLKLKHGAHPTDFERKLRHLTNFMIMKLQCHVELKNYQGFLTYHVTNPAVPWPVLFDTLNILRSNELEFLEDYYIRETSLEDVLLSVMRSYG